MSDFAYNYTLSKETYYEAGLYESRKMLLYFSIFSIVLIPILIWQQCWLPLAFCIFVALAFAMNFFINLRFVRNGYNGILRQYKGRKIKIKIRFYQDVIQYHTSTGRVEHYSYSDILKVYKSLHLIIFHINQNNKKQAICVPRKCLTKKYEKEFLKFVKNKMNH